MPIVAVKLYSVFFKSLLKHRLQNRIQNPIEDPFGVSTLPEETVFAANPLFSDGVATKDIHIDPFTSLSIRIFIPESALNPPDPDPKSTLKKPHHDNPPSSRRNSYGVLTMTSPGSSPRDESRR
ncbi:hypothetical protein ACFE04_010367 [Oxalis oulophora]